MAYKSYPDDHIVRLLVPMKRPGLSRGTMRRAIVERLIDKGGYWKVSDIRKHYDFPIDLPLRGLLKRGWIEIVPE